MKKYNLYLWLAALVGLFASCSQDENAMLQTNESNRVSLTAELPDDFAQIGTRAVPDALDGNHKLRCILEVWDSDLTTLKVRQEAAPGGIEDITFIFTLDQTGEYKALLWADYILSNTEAASATIANIPDVQHFEDEYYKTNSETGLKAVERIKGEMTNPDLLDAFFVCKPFKKEAAALKDLSTTLARPFTKLTIAEKNSENFDYCQTVKAKATIPTQINVATGVVSASQETTMWNAAPSGAEITVGGSACKTLFSTYILATTDGTMQNIKLEFTATTGSGKILKNATIPAGVPAKRNYRVNAAGNLIQAEDEPSENAEMKVDINANWVTPDEEKDVDPKAGDYYYKDGTWSTEKKDIENNPIIGVVTKVYSSDDSRYGKARGKVISLKEESLQWATTFEEVGTDETKGGKENTDYIIANYSLDEYPIFKACNDLRTETGKDWYIPTPEEYTLDIFSLLSNFNSKIEVAEGDQVVIPTGNDNAYWTCFEGDRNHGKTLVSKNQGQILLKTELHKVRFILEF